MTGLPCTSFLVEQSIFYLVLGMICEQESINSDILRKFPTVWVLWNRLPWLSKSVAGGRRLFVNLDTCQRYIYLYICWFFVQNVHQSPKDSNGEAGLSYWKWNSFTLVRPSNEDSTLSTLRFYNQFFNWKIGFMYCIDEFCSSKIRWLPPSFWKNHWMFYSFFKNHWGKGFCTRFVSKSST